MNKFKEHFTSRKGILAALAGFVLCSTVAFAQNVTVTGTVLTDTDEPAIGASVIQVGNSSNGVVTDLDGNFSITVPNNARIEVSCIGFISQTLAVTSTPMRIVLVTDSELIEETVVIGYGVQRKSDLTGSIASVRSQDLANRSTSDAAAALQGKAAGVQIIQPGAPGKGAEIRVRGYSSNSGNIGPLLIVDGLKVDNIQYIDPEMIESIEILKDGASAAIYGAEAGNGVVLITTKSGASSKGEGKVFYNNQFSLAQLSGKLNVMNAKDYIDSRMAQGFLNEAMLSANYDGKTDLDMSKEIFEPTWSSRHTVGFQNGNEKGSLFVSINNVKTNGIFRGDKDVYDRLTAQINADFKIKEWLTIGTNNSIEKWSTKQVSEGDDNGSALLSALTASPLFPLSDKLENLPADMIQFQNNGYTLLQDPETGLYWTAPKIGATQSGNPFVRRDATEGSNGGITVRGVAYANFNPVKSLTFTSRFGYRISHSSSHSFTKPYYNNAMTKADGYTLSANANTGFYYQWENFINYNRTFAQKHAVTAMAGMSFIENHWDNVSVTASGGDILSGDGPQFQYLDYLLTDGVAKNVNNAPGQSASLSYFARLGYTYDDRYAVQANFRADAFDTSKLPADKRWGYFPSVSAGWTISNESFIADNISRDVLSFLKLRASWGVNGNINVLNNYPYSSSIRAGAVYYQYDADDPKLTTGSIPAGLANPNLTWETSEQLDLGIDARLFNNRLSVALDYFDKNTRDLLVGVSPAKEVGLPAFGDLGVGTSTTVNAGKVNNKGVELELSWKDNIGDFSYSIAGNAAYLKNMVTYLEPTVGRLSGRVPQGTKMGTHMEEGHSIWYLLGYKAAGVDAEGNGLYYAADGTVTAGPQESDRVDLGSGIPKWTFGLTINMAWKNFDLTVFGNGVAGNKIFPNSYRVDRPECNTYSYYWNNSWRKAGDEATAKFPAAKYWTTEAFSSTMNLFDGSYFKIKQIQLGYTLPKALLSKVKVNSLRVFATLDNYITFSNYFGLDPETAGGTGVNAGIDMGNYPTSKSVIFGVNLEF